MDRPVKVIRRNAGEVAFEDKFQIVLAGIRGECV